MSFVTPEEFKSYETVAYTKGFLMVASSPLTARRTMPATILHGSGPPGEEADDRC